MPTTYQTASNHSFSYIDNNDDLQTYCDSIKESSTLFIDTEFIREKTYAPILCLIQIASEETLACIDPLAITNIEPFLELIYNDSITKVFHAARQDLEIFYNLRHTAPKPVFDTQIAASLLGHADQIGYGNLVNAIVKVSLDKKYARTDWTQRPLSKAQLEYAINDVIYLRDIYSIICQQLTDNNRRQWLNDDFELLTADSTFQISPEKMWRKVKGHNKLGGLQRAILQDLAAWREQRAIQSDKPRKWILSDDILLSLAQHQPDSTAKLEKIRGLTDGIIRKSGAALMNIIKESLQRPQETWPTLPKFAKTTLQQDALIDCMMAIVRLCAAKEKISSSMLCSRKDLEKWLGNDDSIALLSGWRKKLAGTQVADFLNGDITLSSDTNKLKLTHK
ncbi:Ribonuclease D [hydrothermal vent metagenome]|uniref:Ribonuclease D n=1 Tax=hydrothermal vent metagenome TaxID=652676 RepID=A0A3B0ZJV9_9ZZZZ